MHRLLLALLGFVMLAVPVTAQSTQSIYPGLQYMASRQYATARDKAIDTTSDGALILSIRVLQFDSAANATSSFGTLSSTDTIKNQLPLQSDTVQFEQQTVKDLGDQAQITTVTATNPTGDTGFFRLVYARKGNLVVMSTTIAGSNGGAAKTDDIVRRMLERSPGSGQIAYVQNGTSTGGVWDIFLPANDPALGGLIGIVDTEYRPT